MLVLTRRKSEAIRIGNDVFIKVIRTGRSTVKIGIEAPASVRVVRGELVIHQPDDASLAPRECALETDDATLKPRARTNSRKRKSFHRPCNSVAEAGGRTSAEGREDQDMFHKLRQPAGDKRSA